MFVVDALLGNPDRNNSNWGIVLGMDGSKRIAPVYDNGNCLNCKWDEEKMLEVLSDERKLVKPGKYRNEKKGADSMYNDKTIALPDSLPAGLQSDFKELQEYYDAEDWIQFDLLFEAVEASVKAYYLPGKISREELNLIFRKYGIA